MSVLNIVILPVKTSVELIKLLSCSAQLTLKIILLINVKMLTNVGILTFISIAATRNVTMYQLLHFGQFVTFWADNVDQKCNNHVTKLLLHFGSMSGIFLKIKK